MRSLSRNIDLCHGPIARNIVLFALPILAANLINNLYNMVDTMLVGKFVSDAAQAAVSSTGQLLTMIVCIGSGAEVGVSIIAAQYLGRGSWKEIGKIVRTSVLLAVILGCVSMTVLLFGAEWLLCMMECPEHLVGPASIYLRFMGLRTIGELLGSFGCGLLRASGDSGSPARYTSAMGLVKVLLSILFVVVLKMGVAGTALATVMAYWVYAVLVLRNLTHQTGALQLHISDLKMDPKAAGEIMRVGIPSIISTMTLSLSNVLIQSLVNSMGEAVMAGYGISLNIATLVSTIYMAFCSAASVFMCRNFGACKFKRLERGFVSSCGIVVPLALVCATLIYLLRMPIFSLYTDSVEVMAEATTRMRYSGNLYFLNAVTNVAVLAVQAIGYSGVGMAINLVFSCALRAYWAKFVFDGVHPESLYISGPVSWILTALVAVIAFLILRKRAYAKAEAALQAVKE